MAGELGVGVWVGCKKCRGNRSGVNYVGRCQENIRQLFEKAIIQ